MTEKELHKLSRQDLLELLLSQSKEVARQQAQIAELEEADSVTQESYARLKQKLDEKDAQLEKLKSRLDEKDAAIGSLENQIEEWKAGRRLELEDQVDQILVSSERLKNKLSEKNAQLEELKNRLNQKDATIRDLRTKLEEFRTGGQQELDQAVSQVRLSNEYLKDALSERDQRIRELNSQLQQRDSQIQGLQAETRRRSLGGPGVSAADYSTEVLLRLNEMFAVAQQAANQYLNELLASEESNRTGKRQPDNRQQKDQK